MVSIADAVAEPIQQQPVRRARTAGCRRTTAQPRIDDALAALAPNTRRAYVSAWSAWQRWAATSGCQAIPASAADVAGYLEARHAGGAAPATIRGARAAIAKVHQVSGLADPTADSLCRDVLHRIGREGRRRGRSQVAGIGWAQAEAAAARALVTRRSGSQITIGAGLQSPRSQAGIWPDGGSGEGERPGYGAQGCAIEQVLWPQPVQ